MPFNIRDRISIGDLDKLQGHPGHPSPNAVSERQKNMLINCQVEYTNAMTKAKTSDERKKCLTKLEICIDQAKQSHNLQQSGKRRRKTRRHRRKHRKTLRRK